VAQGARPNCVRVHQQGLYLLKLFPIGPGGPCFIEDDEEESEDEFEVMIGTEVHLQGHESVMRL
jgi:hypothetical protein